MDGPCRVAGRLAEAFGGAPGGRGQQEAMPRPFQHADQRAERGRLAGAGATRQDADLVRQRGADGLTLLFGERFRPAGGAGVQQALQLPGVEIGQAAGRGADHLPDAGGGALLAVVQRRQVDRLDLLKPVRHHLDHDLAAGELLG